MNEITIDCLRKHGACDRGIRYFKNNKEDILRRLNNKNIVVYNDNELEYIKWLLERKLIKLNYLNQNYSTNVWKKWYLKKIIKGI